MIKNTLILKKENRLEWKSVMEIAVGIAYGLCIDERILVIFIVHLYSIYKKGILCYLLFSMLASVSALYLNVKVALLYALVSVLFFICAKLYDILHYSLYKHLFIWNTIFTFICAYMLYNNSIVTYSLVAMSTILSFGFTYLVREEHKESVFSYISVAYLLALHLLKGYAIYVELSYLSLCIYFLPIQISSIVLFYFTLLGMEPLYVLYLLIVGSNTSYKLFLSLLAWISVLYSFTLPSIFFATLCSFLGMFAYESKDRFMEKSERIEREHHLYMEHSFYRQIVNYANVFYNLAHYYEDRSEENAEMLLRMGEALEYNARLSKQYVYAKSELNQRIKELLKGYQFSLVSCEVKEMNEKIMIRIEIENLFEDEMEEAILPLLEKECECSLRVTRFTPYPFHKGKYKILLESSAYPMISTYGNSVHVHEVSGDSFHSFDMDPHVILMLSDGMGKGVKAKKTSTILIQIMEAMMRCHIPQIECIKLMNLFLRSDLYATLDVLSFDRRNGKAYLSKAASAPTYLLREKELYEMNAHSLPIGIVDQVNAEVYEISYQKGDIFIMCSDGVEKDEIEKWVSLKRCTAIKNEGLNLMNIIKRKKRMDDSTILMAKVD